MNSKAITPFPRTDIGECNRRTGAYTGGSVKRRADFAGKRLHPPNLVRKSFAIKEKEIARARLYITAHELYYARINGKKITDAEFDYTYKAPPWCKSKKSVSDKLYFLFSSYIYYFQDLFTISFSLFSIIEFYYLFVNFRQVSA